MAAHRQIFAMHVRTAGFLMHMAEVITRLDFWEVYIEHDAMNFQSSFEMRTILNWPHAEPIYDHGRFITTNGINYNGSP